MVSEETESAKRQQARDAERAETDSSLQRERKKTDVAVSEARLAAARKADDEIARTREKLDKQLAEDRAAAVRSHKFTESLEERGQTDQATAAERVKADKTLLEERQVQTAKEMAFVTEERAQTDNSLRSERHLTDQAYAFAEQLLAGERNSLALAKDAVTTRDEFLAVVSHDLRTPLSVISMCAHELKTASAEKRLTELESQLVDTVLRNSAGMSRLISDLLDVERMASGSLQLARVPCDVNGLIQETLKSFQVWAEKLGIKLSVAPPNGVLPVCVDSDRVRQVLDNLIGNALKFTPRGGSISVRAESDATTVRVAVTDTGPGIAEDKQAHVFDRFSQLKRGDRGGVGLGLFIARWIVEAHNGKIWVESKPNCGSTFFFSLPRSYR